MLEQMKKKASRIYSIFAVDDRGILILGVGNKFCEQNPAGRIKQPNPLLSNKAV